jgi:GNAT superfamily N-acetyltransferase
MKNYTFGKLDITRLDEALALICNVFNEYEAPDYSDEGVQEFLRFLEPENIKNWLIQNQMQVWTCDDKGQIIGVLAARSDHIHLLFVNGNHHRKGIARHFLEMMIEHFQKTEITVNSSPYAVEAYRKLGFVETNSEQIEKGIRFIPMKRTK